MARTAKQALAAEARTLATAPAARGALGGRGARRAPRRGALTVVLAAAGAGAWASGGCTLAPPAPDPIRYFRPEAPAGAAPRPPAAPLGPYLRLEPARASAYLEARIAWRAGEVELGYYETRRWAEHPAALVERAVAGELFLRRGFRRAASGSVAGLDLHVVQFEEVLEPDRAARAAVEATVRDAYGSVVWSGLYATSQRVEADDGRALARAMGAGLADLAARIGADLEAALRRGQGRAPPP